MGKRVYSEFSLAYSLCLKPIIAICGSYGRTTVSHMIGFCLKQEGKKVFVGGTSETPFIEYSMLEDKDEIDQACFPKYLVLFEAIVYRLWEGRLRVS